MFNKIKQWLLALIKGRDTTYQNDLEQFIISKRPATTVEIEHWTRVYEQRTGGFYG